MRLRTQKKRRRSRKRLSARRPTARHPLWWRFRREFASSCLQPLIRMKEGGRDVRRVDSLPWFQPLHEHCCDGGRGPDQF